jgi:hypothetical protein
MSSKQNPKKDICIGCMIATHIYVPSNDWVFVEFVFWGKNYPNYQWYPTVLVVAIESMTQGKNCITLSSVTLYHVDINLVETIVGAESICL